MIRERMSVHPCGKKDLLDLFGDYRRLSRRLAKLAKRGKLRCVGTAQLKEDGGRPENVYFIGQVRTDWLDHELRITRVVRAAGWPDMLRLYDVPKVKGVYDGKEVDVRPDGQFAEMGRLLEMDCGTEPQVEIEKKAVVLGATGKAIMWVMLSEARMKKLKAWTEAAPLSLFALYQDLLDKPGGEVWTDHAGSKVATKL